jgi:hypothetical protein
MKIKIQWAYLPNLTSALSGNAALWQIFSWILDLALCLPTSKAVDRKIWA